MHLLRFPVSKLTRNLGVSICEKGFDCQLLSFVFHHFIVVLNRGCIFYGRHLAYPRGPDEYRHRRLATNPAILSHVGIDNPLRCAWDYLLKSKLSRNQHFFHAKVALCIIQSLHIGRLQDISIFDSFPYCSLHTIVLRLNFKLSFGSVFGKKTH